MLVRDDSLPRSPGSEQDRTGLPADEAYVARTRGLAWICRGGFSGDAQVMGWSFASSGGLQRATRRDYRWEIHTLPRT
jgi:hypothetical protein